jgi:hypothetical protein
MVINKIISRQRQALRESTQPHKFPSTGEIKKATEIGRQKLAAAQAALAHDPNSSANKRKTAGAHHDKNLIETMRRNFGHPHFQSPKATSNV